jgi:hypothetical protein
MSLNCARGSHWSFKSEPSQLKGENLWLKAEPPWLEDEPPGSKVSLNGLKLHAFRASLQDFSLIFMAQGQPQTFVRKDKAEDMYIPHIVYTTSNIEKKFVTKKKEIEK